jgi:hypothetical protein
VSGTVFDAFEFVKLRALGLLSSWSLGLLVSQFLVRAPARLVLILTRLGRLGRLVRRHFSRRFVSANNKSQHVANIKSNMHACMNIRATRASRALDVASVFVERV